MGLYVFILEFWGSFLTFDDNPIQTALNLTFLLTKQSSEAFDALEGYRMQWQFPPV